MHVFIAAVVALVVGAVCGYAFRGAISHEKDYLGGEVKSGLGNIAKKL